MKIALSLEDKKMFASGTKTATARELLIIIAFVKEHEEKFTEADLKFMHSHMGRRAERLLRNSVKNFSFED